ncbi:GNAT family N-acetyltransferase [Lysobacter korlensis]|uniref:GNAT family N-acetyltransferase n=1 Tax=Lysobacter korlensis TaxID=553636 RepID=A0ABV6RRI8_9GAMM
MATTLRTPRLDLAAFVLEDAEGLHALFSDPLTHTFVSGPITDIAKTREWIARRREAHECRGLAWYAIRARSSDVLIGNCGLFLGRTGDDPEIGLEVAHRERGHGIAPEAAAAVLGEAHAAGIRRVWATVRPGNTASLRVLDRIGMRLHRRDDDAHGELLYLCADLGRLGS